jgi:O-acetyl-ADP-ribose deacetylase (regulator of RNase III)
MIRYIEGNIFASRAQVLVNSVNCCGVMGAGIALEFRKRFPKMYRAYRRACQKGELDIGRPFLWKGKERWILNFPTKLHYVQPARLEYIERGLQWIVNNYRKEGITSMAMPKLGTELGRLPWSDVKVLLERYLAELADLDVEVYEWAGNANCKRPQDRLHQAQAQYFG